MVEPTMRGRLDVVPLLELLSALARTRKSGTLELHSGLQSMFLTIEHGSVRAVSTDDPALRIGQVLIRLGLVTEEQIEQALALQSIATDPERVGEVLVDVNYITETDISHAMTVQIRTALNVMLDDDSRYFEFSPDEETASSNALPDVSLDPLVRTVSDLARSWLARFDFDQDEFSAFAPRENDTLEELPIEQQTLITRLLETYHRLDRLIADRNRHAHRVQQSIERLLKHVLTAIAAEQERSRPREPGESHLLLVDQQINLWTLADLTRTARHLLLYLMNGEHRRSVLASEIFPMTSNPDRAFQELISAGLITVEADGTAENEAHAAREALFQLLPAEH